MGTERADACPRGRRRELVGRDSRGGARHLWKGAVRSSKRRSAQLKVNLGRTEVPTSPVDVPPSGAHRSSANWHNSDLPRCPRSGRQSGGKRTSRARERAAVPPRHRGRARERAEDPTIIPAPPPLCWAGGGPDAAAIPASVTRPFQEMRSKRN